MTSDKAKQLLRILKRQALVVSSQNNEKMNAIGVGEFFRNSDAVTRITLNHLT